MTKFNHNLLPWLGAILLILSIASCDSMKDKGTPGHPVNIPETALDLKDATMGLRNGRVEVSAYNGSDWVIVDIDVLITKTASNHTRKFRLRAVEKRKNDQWKTDRDALYLYTDAPFKPFSSGDLEGSCGDFSDGLKKEDFQWTISSARGYKQ